jgi:hypothetical protein
MTYRRDVVGTFVLSAFLWSGGPSLAQLPLQAEERPNFLIILCGNLGYSDLGYSDLGYGDLGYGDLGYGNLGCCGSKTVKTPHLDQLAKQGALLRSCYSTATVWRFVSRGPNDVTVPKPHRCL